MKNKNIYILTALLMLIITGCSAGHINPIQPQAEQDADLSMPVAQVDEGQTNRIMLNTGRFQFDFESLGVNIIPARQADFHFNVTEYLHFPSAEITYYEPLTGMLSVNVTLANTLLLDGYDARLIIYSNDSGVTLMNPDDWTSLWDIADGADINPFKAYAQTEPQRTFASMHEFTEQLQFYMPSGVDYIDYAIDVSYPENCDEPYAIENFSQGILYDTANAETIIEVDVLDWQDDVDEVKLYCPAITNEIFVQFEQVGNSKWRLNLTNANGAAQGDYIAAIIATSENSNGLELYDLVKITVTEDTQTEWTLLLYYTEDNLGDRIQGDINEMEVIGSPEGKMNVIVCWDKDASPDDVILKIERDPDGYNDTIISSVIDDGGEVIPPGGLPHAKIAYVEKFLRWGMREYPAKKYGFIPYGHGNGPFRSAPDPDDFLVACGGMQVWEIRDACRTVLDEVEGVDKFEFISIVSCLLGWIETAYTLKDVSKTCMASEWLMWASAWEYTELFGYIADNAETCTYQDIASEFVTNYLAYSPTPATYSAWECSMIDTVVVPALDSFSLELIGALDNYRTEITSCRTLTGKWGAYCNDDRVKDLGLFAELIHGVEELPQSLRDAAVGVSDAIAETMIESGHTGDGTKMCPYYETGWHIWFPVNYNHEDCANRRADYVTIGFSDTQWDDFLDAFDNAE